MSGGSIVYVTYDCLLEPLGISEVVPVVEGLAAMGFDMEVLSFEKPEDLASHAAIRAMEGRLSGSGARWTRARYHARPSVPATALDILAGIRMSLIFYGSPQMRLPIEPLLALIAAAALHHRAVRREWRRAGIELSLLALALVAVGFAAEPLKVVARGWIAGSP